jgi:hypothetical protein
MLFGLLVLGPLVMLLVFAFVRSERAMGLLRRLADWRPWKAPTAEHEPGA